MILQIAEQEHPDEISRLRVPGNNHVRQLLKKSGVVFKHGVLFYHSVDDKAVVGIARVKRTAYADKTAKEGDWSAIDLAPVKPLRRPVALAEIKKNPRLKKMPLVRLSRLSVSQVSAAEFREIMRMGN